MTVELLTTGNKIAYQALGSGPALVFIHAGGLDQQMWQGQIKAFQESYRVITYDVRGHGQSLSLNEEAWEIEDLMAILPDNERIHLVGCSFGSILALDFALAYPDRLRSLTLVSPGLIGFQEGQPDFQSLMTEYIAGIQANDMERILQSLMRMNAVGQVDRALAPEVAAYVEHNLSTYLQSGNYLRVPKIKETAPLSVVDNLDVPVLIITGGLDFDYIEQNAAKLVRELPHATWEVIEEVAHLVNMEKLEAFNLRLRAFLDAEN